MSDILAIVGSTTWPLPAHLHLAEQIIRETLDARRPDEIVSGGAVGIDTLAKVIGDEYGIPVVELLPRHRRWKPAGFQERNLLIAQRCTRLLCIRSAQSQTYGSGWTADRAEGMNKPVRRVIIGDGPSLNITVSTFLPHRGLWTP